MLKSYKGLKVELDEKEQPVLVSPTYRYKWGVSTEEVAQGFEAKESGMGAGFYSLKSPEQVASQGYWDKLRWPHVLAEIIPHGTVVHGYTGNQVTGYRSERASLSAIYKEDHVCDACDKAIGEVLVHRGKEETPILLCKKCLEKVKRALPKAKLKELEINTFWKRLSERYGIPVTELPK